MSTTPVVTVVVVSYNTRDLTVQGLRTLADAPTQVPFELVVVDNASSDGSADAVAAALPGAQVVRLPANVGFGRAVNAGLERARGEFVLLLNPDAEAVGDLLGALVAAARARPAARLWVGRTLDRPGHDDGRSVLGFPTLWSCFCFAAGLSTLMRRSPRFNPEELPSLDRGVAGPVPAGSGCVLLVDRDLLRRLGGFTPDYFMYSEDVDLAWRAREAGAEPWLVPEAQVVHANGASSTSAGKRAMVLRGRVTFMRLRWSPRRAAAGTALLLTGVAVRAAGSRLTGRARYWRTVWQERSTWSSGWPAPAPAPDVPTDVTPA